MICSRVMVGQRRGTAGGSGRAWNALALLLALCLAVVSVEAAVHSVHHATEPGDAATCPVFLGTQHSTATAAERPVLILPAPTEGPRVVLASARIRLPSPVEPLKGRSPPPLPTA